MFTRIVAITLVSFFVLGSGKLPPPLPLRGTFDHATQSGALCVTTHERTTTVEEATMEPPEYKELSFELRNEYRELRFELSGKERVPSKKCTIETKKVSKYKAWLVTKKGERFKFKDGRHEVPKGEFAEHGWFEGEGAYVEIQVDGKTHKVFELGAALSQGVQLTVRSNPSETTWGVRATTHYGPSMCPNTGHEVLMIIDRKAGNAKVIYNGFLDETPEIPTVPHDSFVGLTELLASP